MGFINSDGVLGRGKKGRKQYLTIPQDREKKESLFFNSSFLIVGIAAWNVMRSSTGDRIGYVICHLVENPIREGHESYILSANSNFHIL